MHTTKSPQAGERTHEQVGRQYSQVRYGVHSRRVNGDGNWYGTSHYKTRKEADEALKNLGKPILGGMVSFAGGKELFEYRIVRIEAQCTIEAVEDHLV